MQEDMGLCTYFKHHKQKIYYFLGCMRSHSNLVQISLEISSIEEKNNAVFELEEKFNRFLMILF